MIILLAIMINQLVRIVPLLIWKTKNMKKTKL